MSAEKNRRMHEEFLKDFREVQLCEEDEFHPFDHFVLMPRQHGKTLISNCARARRLDHWLDAVFKHPARVQFLKTFKYVGRE